ncbi:MAG: hypothetical protein KAU14_02805 [Thermoplasmata archaeon]|nr:hypothetical protein [Thermoplasmata archaeon]
MKKVEEMSIENMQRYFRGIERLKRSFGRSYRLFWPLRTLSPFSPTRITLNIGVLLSWLFLISWLIFKADSLEGLVFLLAKLWAVVIVISIIIGLFERHFNIKRRYRVLTAPGYYHQTQHTPPPDQPTRHPSLGQPTRHPPPGQPTRHPPPDQPPGYPLHAQEDFVRYGKEFLRRILK